jgi:WD40 repeat protein
VLTAGQDAAVHVWDPATGRELHTLRGHAPPVVATWSPAGEVATADAAGTIRLWTGDGQLRASIPGGRGASNWIAFASTGERFAVARADGSVAIGDPRSAKVVRAWPADPTAVEVVHFDPAGARVVTAGTSGTAVVWSLEGRALARLEGHTQPIWHVVFDPTGEQVITASLDATARVWDARSGKTIHRLVGHEERVTTIAVDRHTRRIATASADTTVRVWSLDTGEALATLRGHTAQVTGVVFAPDDQLISISGDGTARVWDLSHGIQTAMYHHGGLLKRVDLDPEARRLATASWAGTAKLWDLRRQSRLETYASPVARAGEGGTLTPHPVVAAGRLARIGRQGLAVWELAGSQHWTWSAPEILEGALSADGKIAIAVDAEGVIHVLDAKGNRKHRFRGPGRGATCIAAFPDGRRAVTCGPGGLVAVWDLATGRSAPERRVGAVNAIILSRDGGVLFAFESTGQPQGKAAGWLLPADLSRASRLDHDGSLIDARFSPDGARLATLSFDGTARIWSRDGALEATLRHGAPVMAAAWSSDGSWLATGTTAGTLTIWERSSWRVRKAIEAHVNFIPALAIDDRDSLIASGSGDGHVKLWDVETLLQVARIPTGKTVRQLAFERDRLLVSGPLATQSWRCDRYGQAHP